MRRTVPESRVLWLVLGLLSGLGIAYFWPHEPAYATNSDRDSQFAMLTVEVGASGAGISDPMDGVFILDFLTAQLKGAVMNRSNGKFQTFYTRDLAKDFNVDPDAQPRFAICSGYAQLPGQGGVTFASGMLYVAELTSGKVHAYAFAWKDNPRPAGQILQLVPVDGFPWRKAAPKD